MSDATLSRTTLNPGDLLEGKYRILKKLAEGGMGAVYHATQEPLGRDVAVKVLKSFDETAEERQNRFKRFFREAAICSRLNHPNTVMIFDYGELSDKNGFFLVMEYLRGDSLRDVLSRHGVLTTSMALHIAIQIAGSLADAHNGGVVHRDLKPPNIMLVERGGDPYFVKVVDFGLVKNINQGEETGELTAENTLIGSPMYMAPERFLYHSADSPAVDTYALGIMLYEMLVGRPPFIRDSDSTVHRIMMQHIQSEPPPMRHFKPDLRLPDGLEQLVMSCLVKDPNHRLNSMDTLVRLLKACQQGSAVEVPPVLQPGARPTMPESTSDHLLGQNTQNTVRLGTSEQPRPDFPSVITSAPLTQQQQMPQQMPQVASAPAGMTNEIPVAAGSSKAPMMAIVLLVCIIAGFAGVLMLRTPATSLVVETTPPGAQVSIDGQALGVTPLKIDLDLKNSGTLRIEKEGFKAFERGLSPSKEPVVIALPLEDATVAKPVEKPVEDVRPVEQPAPGNERRAKLRAAGCLDDAEDLCADDPQTWSCLAGKFKQTDAECQDGMRALAKLKWEGVLEAGEAAPELPQEAPKTRPKDGSKKTPPAVDTSIKISR